MSAHATPPLLPAALLAAALASGCSPAAEPARPPPPAPVASVAPAASSAAKPESEVPMGLGPLLPLDPSPPRELRPTMFAMATSRKGAAGIAYHGGQGRCHDSEGLPPSCSLAYFAPFVGDAGKGAGWLGPVSASDVAPWQAIPAAAAFGQAFPGRDAVVAVTTDKKTILLVDERTIQSFRVPDGSGLLDVLHLVETSKGRALLGLTATRLRGHEVEVLAIYPLDLEEGKAKLGPPAVLPFSRARAYIELDFLRQAGLRPALSVTPSLAVTDAGELAPTFTLTWVEPLFPVPNAPPRLVPGSPSWELNGPPALDDPEIPRRYHVARFDRNGAQKGESVTRSPPLSRSTKARGEAPPQPALVARPMQWPVGLSFDTRTRTGEAIYNEPGAWLAVRFDERGAPLGPPAVAAKISLKKPPTEVAGRRVADCPELASIAPSCAFGVEVRPDLFVLLCDEPSGQRKPGRLGLRTYRRDGPFCWATPTFPWPPPAAPARPR